MCWSSTSRINLSLRMTMSANTTLTSCNFPLPHRKKPNLITQSQYPGTKSSLFPTAPTISSNLLQLYCFRTIISQKGALPICKSSFNTKNSKNPNFITLKSPHFSRATSNSLKLISLYHYRNVISQKGTLQICLNFINREDSEDPVSGGEDLREEEIGGEKGEWTTSLLLFLLWCGLIFYVFNLAPNQTPSRDMYFLEKLLNLKGDDGFRMNQVLVSLWFIMGLWPLTYSMLLLPTARSSKIKIPLWPFLFLSCFGGAYALIPYFVLWKPPSPPIQESELGRWPLNFLESKLTAAISLAAGLGLIIYAGLASGLDWKEFLQYFNESKFIHATSIDFTLLSTFAPFWVYNDMTARKWYEKGSWLIPLSLIPFLGPSLYILLRPSLNSEHVPLISSSVEDQ